MPGNGQVAYGPPVSVQSDILALQDEDGVPFSVNTTTFSVATVSGCGRGSSCQNLFGAQDYDEHLESSRPPRIRSLSTRLFWEGDMAVVIVS